MTGTGTASGTTDMDTLTVKRWRRFGKDRLYVNLPDGDRVGWLDLQTGQSTL